MTTKRLSTLQTRTLAGAAGPTLAAAGGPSQDGDPWLGVSTRPKDRPGSQQSLHVATRTVGGVPVFGSAHGPRLLELLG